MLVERLTKLHDIHRRGLVPVKRIEHHLYNHDLYSHGLYSHGLYSFMVYTVMADIVLAYVAKWPIYVWTWAITT